MKRFIAQRNIENFKAAIAKESDPARRALLEELLAEEKAKLTQAKADAAERPKAG